MADHVILHKLDGSEEGERILAEFEQRTGMQAEVQGDDRIYEIHHDGHRQRIV